MLQGLTPTARETTPLAIAWHVVLAAVLAALSFVSPTVGAVAVAGLRSTASH